MPIVLLIFSTLAFWGLFWFVRMGGLEHMRQASLRRKEAEKSARAREAQRTAPLRAVDDPRDAALILMLLIARVGGDPTREHIAAVERLARATFGFDRDLPERMAQARFIAARAESFEQAAVAFAELLRRSLTRAEMSELIDMIDEVARVEGPSTDQTDAMAVLSRRIGLSPAA
jgi:uncharacterized tellurite resistance protein B-like protein